MSEDSDSIDGPVFPRYQKAGEFAESSGGATLRDLFAGLAIAGMRANPNLDLSLPSEAVAKCAFRDADAMLRERLR